MRFPLGTSANKSPQAETSGVLSDFHLSEEVSTIAFRLTKSLLLGIVRRCLAIVSLSRMGMGIRPFGESGSRSRCLTRPVFDSPRHCDGKKL